MTKCFLCYSESYKPLMLRMKNLLVGIGFEVDVFDEPAQESTDKITKERISAADCVLVLLGPHAKPDTSTTRTILAPAQRPMAEATLANALEKPVVLILHHEVSPPPFFSDQTWPHFDFWSAENFFDNVHHVVKRLLELKESFELPRDTNYEIKKVEFINRIESRDSLVSASYNEIIARNPCARFSHSIDTAKDETPEAAIGQVTCNISQTLGEPKTIKIITTKVTDFEYSYVVEVSPKLRRGETIGYRRFNRIRNRFPLTRSELETRIGKPGFPEVYGRRFYGDAFDVVADLRSLRFAIHFPWDVNIVSYDVVVLDYETRDRNEAVTAKARNFLKFRLDEVMGERILELIIDRPNINHSYYLLYEPGD